MKINPSWLVLFLFVATLLFPWLFQIGNGSFSWISLLSNYKNISLPVWTLFFSLFWIIYRLRYDRLKYITTTGPSHILDLKKTAHLYNSNSEIQKIEERIRIAERAKANFENLQIAIAITGFLIGIITLLHNILTLK